MAPGPQKALTAAHSFKALGVSVSLAATARSLQFVVRAEKCSKWLAVISGILANQRLTPAGAQNLAGRLS